jgi:hypothetical protein
MTPVVPFWCLSAASSGRQNLNNDEDPLFLLVRGPSQVVGDTGIEPVTSSVSRAVQHVRRDRPVLLRTA